MKNEQSSCSIDRRSFLGAAAPVLAATAVSCQTAPSAHAMRESRIDQVALQTYSLKELNLHHLLPAVASAGYNLVDLYDRHVSPLASEEDLLDAEQDFVKNSIQVDGLYTEKLSRSAAECERVFKTAKRFGARVLTTSVTHDVLAVAAPVAADYDMALAVHNAGPAPGKLFVSLDDVKRALDVHAHVSSCADLGNFVRADEDPLAAINALGERIQSVHFKDLSADGSYVLMGQGVLDLKGMISALRNVGYNRPLTIEYTASAGDIEARIAHLAYNRLMAETLVRAT